MATTMKYRCRVVNILRMTTTAILMMIVLMGGGLFPPTQTLTMVAADNQVESSGVEGTTVGDQVSASAAGGGGGGVDETPATVSTPTTDISDTTTGGNNDGVDTENGGDSDSDIAANDLIEMGMGRMVMQLRSSVDTDTMQLQSTMQSLTNKYLTAYFASYYDSFGGPPQPVSIPQDTTTTIQMEEDEAADQDDNDNGNSNSVVVDEATGGVDLVTSTTANDPAEYFVGVNLAVGSFGVHGVSGSFISTLEFAGTVVFGYSPPPSQPFINTLVRNAFQGVNERLYIEHLLSSNFQFLEELTHIIIEVDNTALVEVSLKKPTNGDKEGNDDGTESSSNTENVSAATESNSTSNEEAQDKTNDKHWLIQERWAEILLYVAAGCIGIIGILCCFSLLRCCCCNPGSKTTTTVVDEPVKVVEVPTKPKQQQQEAVESVAPSRSSYTGSRYSSKRERRHGRSKSSSSSSSHRRSTYPAKHYDDSLLDQLERAAPSPDRSMSSQDSSMFTYSDNMSMSKASVGSTSRFSVGSISRFSMDMPSIDLGAWQNSGRSSTSNKVEPNGSAPFGHDISAIGKRDLSLIQEESNDSGHSRDTPPTRGRSTRRDLGFNDTSIQSDSSDVIADLRNLSIQIKRQARKSGSGRKH